MRSTMFLGKWKLRIDLLDDLIDFLGCTLYFLSIRSYSPERVCNQLVVGSGQSHQFPVFRPTEILRNNMVKLKALEFRKYLLRRLGQTFNPSSWSADWDFTPQNESPGVLSLDCKLSGRTSEIIELAAERNLFPGLLVGFLAKREHERADVSAAEKSPRCRSIPTRMVARSILASRNQETVEELGWTA